MFDTALEESSQLKDPFFALELAVCQQHTDGIVLFVLMKLNYCNWIELFPLTTLFSFWRVNKIIYLLQVIPLLFLLGKGW